MWNLSWLKLWNLPIVSQLHRHFKVWNNTRWHDPSWRWAGNRVVCGHSCVNWYHLCPNVPYLQRKMLQFTPCHHKPTLNFRVEIIWGHRCILLCLLLCLMIVNLLFNKKYSRHQGVKTSHHHHFKGITKSFSTKLQQGRNLVKNWDSSLSSNHNECISMLFLHHIPNISVSILCCVITVLFSSHNMYHGPFTFTGSSMCNTIQQKLHYVHYAV